MRQMGSGGGSTPNRKRIVKKTARGPQGLPTQAVSAQRVRTPAPKPVIQRVAQAVAAQPKLRKSIRRATKAQQADLRVSGDRPTPGGRTHGQDGRSGPDYRAVLRTLTEQEHHRLNITPSSDHPVTEDYLANLRTLTSHNGRLYRGGHKLSDSDPTNPLSPMLTKANLGQYHSSSSDLAPVLKGLEQTTRPLHAIAGATDAALHGRNIPKAALRGAENKDTKTFGKVLRGIGVPKGAANAIGFVADVGLDPTTYTTFGAGSVLRKTAEDAAKQAESKALKSGLTEEQARRFAQRAETQTLKRGKNAGHGLTVKVAGKEVPAVRRATAKVVPHTLTRKVGGSKVGQAVKHVAADLNPDIAPAGMTQDEAREVTRATRTTRAKIHRGAYAAQQRAIAIKRQVGEENYQQIIDAIESGRTVALPPNLRKAASEVQSLFRHADRVRRQGGLPGGVVTRRAKVKVPEVTARPIEQTQREVAKAERSVSASRRRLAATLEARGISQGRAEMLSRQVAGAKGEHAAEAAGRVRGRLDRAEERVRTGSPQDVLRFIDEASLASERYAGGGHGVGLSRAAHDLAKSDLTRAERRLAEAKAEHTTQKTLRKEQAKAQREAIKTNEHREISATGYYPHIRAETVEPEQVAARRASGKTVKSGSYQKRTDPRPLSEIRQEKPGYYSEDLPRVVADRMSEASRTAAKSELNRRLIDRGRAIPKDGSDIAEHVKEGESVYHVKGASIAEVTDRKELEALTKPTRVKGSGKISASTQAKRGGRFVVLNKQMVDRALESAAPTQHGPGIVRGLDKMQGGFKYAATVPNPGFHLRNIVGDTSNAYLAESAPRLARNLKQAGGLLRQLGKREESLRHLGRQLDPSGKGIVVKGQRIPYEHLLKEAEDTGAIRSGFIAREIPELMQKDVTKGRDRLHRFSRLVQNREDVVRLATFIGGRKRGMTAEEAADHAAAYHFDYGHLTNFERQIARRAMPFYTFSARNIPLQARSLLTKPGKYANYEKLREEAANAAGLDDPQPQHVRDLYTKLQQAGVQLPKGWDRLLTAFEQRNAGIPIKAGKSTYDISMGLPLTDLNELPGLAGNKQLSEWVQRLASMTTPVLKDPAELAFNYSTFFRAPIESDTSPLVQAPPEVGTAAFAPFRKKLGIVSGTNKRTGKPMWLWPGRVDYVAHALPGPTNYIQQVSSAAGAGKRGVGNALLAYAGVKATKIDPLSAAVALAYERMTEISKKQAALRQQGFSSDNPNAEYTRLTDQLHVAEEVAYQAKAARGDVVLPKAGGPKKLKGGFDFSGAGAGNFDFSGAGGSSKSGNFDFSGAGG